MFKLNRFSVTSCDLKPIIYTVALLLFVSVIFLRNYTPPSEAAAPSTASPPTVDNECQSSNSKLNLGVKGFLKTSESYREMFLKKRNDHLLRNRSLSEIDPWNDKAVEFFWHYFPPTFTCPHFIQRIGQPSDGGKWLCGLDLFEKDKLYGCSKKPCIVYSFGVAGDSSFEEEILRRTSCSVFAFDHTVDKMNLNSSSDIDSSRVKFTKKGIDVSASDTTSTLGEFMKENGHKWIDYLKMDVEGSEYVVLEQILNEFGTFPFSHLNLEVHLPRVGDDNEVFKNFFEWWEKLENGGLRPFIWEDNYYFTVIGSQSKPTLMEYGFVNIKSFDNNRLLQF